MLSTLRDFHRVADQDALRLEQFSHDSINLRFIFSGSPPTLWWLLITALGPLNDTLNHVGVDVPCTELSTCPT